MERGHWWEGGHQKNRYINRFLKYVGQRSGVGGWIFTQSADSLRSATTGRQHGLQKNTEYVAKGRISSYSPTLTTWSTARLIPRRRSMGFMPAATDLQPSLRIARVSTVAVVVPESKGTSTHVGK